MLDTRALTEAIKQHFHEIMETTDVPKRRALIDSIFDYEVTLHAVARTMAEPELAV